MSHRILKPLLAAAIAVSALAVTATSASAVTPAIPGIDHIVVIYEENHSFDNLFGSWPDVNGQHVEGLGDATSAETTQVDQTGTPFSCLLQLDVNLTTTRESGPLAPSCNDKGSANTFSGGRVAVPYNSAFTNAPFDIGTYIPAAANTCPAPGNFSTNGYLPNAPGTTSNGGGCTRDLVHRFYQEQWQIHGGAQNRYEAGSDAAGLTQGYYQTSQLPIYQYLTSAGAPKYVVADHFFQGGFGGSFLNHQVLVSGQAPLWPGGADHTGAQSACGTATVPAASPSCDLHSVVDNNGFPNSGYPHYSPVGGGTVRDNQLTEWSSGGACTPSYASAPTAPAGTLCGDYAINTTQPFTQPYSPGTAIGKRLPLLTADNIGDRMSAAGVSWGWYSGGWGNAAGLNGADANHPLSNGWNAGATNTTSGTCTASPGSNLASGVTFPYCPDADFQYHHQALGYYANYADGTAGRAARLKDETDLINEPDWVNPSDTSDYTMHSALPQVAFIKPIGQENEHPGYASERDGSNHLVKLVKALLGPSNPDAAHTMVVVTYDEFGGQWDHVAPPGQGNGLPHDAYGPGTRIPALVISPALDASGVDHTSHDTVSILATIEHQFGVSPITPQAGAAVQTLRDTTVADLSSAFTASSQAPESHMPLLLTLPFAAVTGATLALRRRRKRA